MIYKFIVFITLAVLTITGCEKLPENGKLDGQWQLLEIHRNGQEPQHTKENGIYWRFQLDLLMIHSSKEPLNGHTYDTSAKFYHKGNQLNITETYIHFINSDSLLTDPETSTLKALGIDGNAESFAIDQLDRKKMILSTEEKQLIFRKF